MKRTRGQRENVHLRNTIVLESQYAQVNDGDGVYDFELPHERLSDESGYLMELAFLTMDHAVYPINDNHDKLYVEEAGPLVHTVTLPHGYYTPTNMANELQTQLNAVSASTFGVTYDSITHKFIIGSTAAFSIYATGTHTIAAALGFVTDTASAVSTTSQYPINLEGTRYVNVFSNLPTTTITVNNKKHLLAHVPMPGGFGNTIYYEPEGHPEMFVNSTRLQNITLWFRDDQNRRYVFPPNSYFTAVFRVTRVLSPKIMRLPHALDVKDSDDNMHFDEIES